MLCIQEISTANPIRAIIRSDYKGLKNSKGLKSRNRKQGEKERKRQ